MIFTYENEIDVLNCVVCKRAYKTKRVFNVGCAHSCGRHTFNEVRKAVGMPELAPEYGNKSPKIKELI